MESKSLPEIAAILTSYAELLNEGVATIDRLTSEKADLLGDNAELREMVNKLTEENDYLKAELAKTAPAPTPPPPAEKVPDVEISLDGIGLYRPIAPGERQGKEVRYVALNRAGRAEGILVDAHDDGQIRVIFERCQADLPVLGNRVIETHLTVRVDGKTHYDAPFRLHAHQRPPITINPSPPPSFDLGTLVATGLVPNYDLSARPSEDTLARMAAGRYPWNRWTGGGRLFNPISESFSIYWQSWAGGPEASMLNPAEVAFLLSGDPRAWNLVREIADSSGNYAIHYKVHDNEGGHWPRADETAGLPFLQTDASVTIKTAAGVTCPVPDVAHMHSLAYVAALLTGDRYYREEVEAWAAYALLAQPADKDRLKGLLWTGQVRGAAWGLRALLHAVLISNHFQFEGSEEEWLYLEEQLANNLQWMTETFVNPGSPHHRPTGVTSIKPFRHAEMTQYIVAEPKPDYFATWNEEILAFVLDEIARAGFDEAAAMRDHVLKVAEGVWRHSPTVYDVGWGNHAYASTWPEIMKLTFEGRAAKPTTFVAPVTQDYTAWFRSAVVVGARNGVYWAVEALAKLDPFLAGYKGGVPAVWRVNP